MELRFLFFLLFTAFVAPFNLTFGQKNIDESVLIVEYQTLQLCRSDWPHPSDELNRLLCIGEKCSMLQSILPLHRPNRPYTIDESAREYYNCHDNDILQGYPEGQMTCKARVSSEGYYYTESLPAFDWQMLDGDTVVCGYECQKASTVFRGRTWTVWYTMELPYSYGPWKLGGLPGLILKALDDKNQYSYEAIEIKKGGGKKIKLSTAGYKKSSAEDVYKEIVRQAKNPTQYEMNLGHGYEPYEMDGIRHEFHLDPWTPYPLEYFDVKVE